MHPVPLKPGLPLPNPGRKARLFHIPFHSFTPEALLPRTIVWYPVPRVCLFASSARLADAVMPSGRGTRDEVTRSWSHDETGYEHRHRELTARTVRVVTDRS